MSLPSQTYPCFTGMNLACMTSPYEDVADVLANAIGVDNARTALKIIGNHAQAMSREQLMSNLLTAYGVGLTEVSYATRGQVNGEHRRYGST